MSGEALTLVLGDEYDHALIARTWSVLAAMGARRVDALGFVAGSQEVSIQIWDLGGATLRFEAETYMGLTVSGERKVVQRLVDDVRARLRA